MARPFPEEVFNFALEQENWEHVEKILYGGEFYMSVEQVDSMIKDEEPKAVLARAYALGKAFLEEGQVRRLWRSIDKMKLRFLGSQEMVDKFLRRAKADLKIEEEEELVKKGSAWMKKNLPEGWEDASERWGGIYCKGRSNKYLWSMVRELPDGAWEFSSKFGRIGNKPQGPCKIYRTKEEAVGEFERYTGEKMKKYKTVLLDRGLDSSKGPVESKKQVAKIKTYGELVKTHAPFVGPAETVLGEILKAVRFLEFRARFRNDWLSLQMTSEERASSLCREPLGFLLSTIPELGRPIEGMLESKSKEEWMGRIDEIKSMITGVQSSGLIKERMEDVEGMLNSKNERRLEDLIESSMGSRSI